MVSWSQSSRAHHDEVEEFLRAGHLEIATSGSFGAYHYCHCGMWSSLEAGTETFVEHIIQATRDAVAAEIRAVAADPDRRRPVMPGGEVHTDYANDFEWAAMIAEGDV